ncbi:MAG: toll/interleukin-1 receptor domain-containing protein [Candidatus Kapabacteria bacterium]|nr:toll/interleukin-1 receptor domain-containing protein [Candidatus Kapabacteria bacterium]
MKKKEQEVASEQISDAQIIQKQGTPFVFISHDVRDAELAEIFSELIRKVSSGMLKCFRSSDKKGDQGIEFGREWYPELMKKLNEATDIIALLTSNSIEKPWILFETGIARGNKNNIPIIGIALGITLDKVATSGPFAQFQNSSDDEDYLLKLVLQLCSRISGLNPDKEIATNLVKDFVTKKDAILSNKPVEKKNDEKDESIVIKIFEELKIMNQDLIYKVSEKIEPEFKRRSMRFHPEYFHKLFKFSNEIGIHNSFLVMISVFKNDFPWLYEIGLETYKVLKNNKSEKDVRNSIREFEKILEFSIHSPFSREIFRYEKEFMFFFEEFHMFLSELIHISTFEKQKPKIEKDRIDKISNILK